ncbi:MAG: hypothetical protein K2Q23_02910, partial [Bryobacteraceae bacterium]|nr:hypothetical protein [Bryobacteraceae bacterium]
MGKILAIVWAIVGVLALLVLAAPDLVALGFFLLIIPGIILAAMPTVFLYVSIFCGVWFAVRRKGDWAATGAGILASAIVAVEVPILLNGVTERRLAEAAALEAAPPKPAPELAAVPIPVVVIEFSGRSSANPGCDELCQLLLYNDIAAKVEVRPAFTPSKKPRPPKVYRIVRDDCSIDAETLKSLRESSWERWTDAAKAKEIARAVRGRIAGEECLAVEEGPAGAENVRVRYLDDWIGNAEAKLALEPGGVWVKGVEIRNGARILARETVRGAAPLLMPLHLEPISSGLGFSGWRWGRKPKPSTPPALDRLAILRRFTPWDLDHPWAGGSTAIRRRLDQALAHPGGSNAAFILLPDYYELLREDEALDKDDRARLARLILDERVEDFSYFHWSEKQRTRVGDVIRDAFLRRMLAEQGRSKKAVTSRLDALAGNLSPGTYAAPAPWLDELLRDPHERRFYPNLVKRLADQGSAGGE